MVCPNESVPCDLVECCATSPRSPAFCAAALICNDQHKQKGHNSSQSPKHDVFSVSTC